MTEDFIFDEHVMFEVPLVVLDVKNWSEKRKLLLELYKKEIEYFNKCDDDYYQQYTSYHTIVDDESKSHRDQVAEILNDEIEFIKNKYDRPDLFLRDSWFQLYGKTHEHSVHNHGAVGYSFVCYIKYDTEEHKPTTFISPFYNFWDGNVLSYSPKNICEGKIIFFPSSIMHFAPQNKSERERIILSGNLKKIHR